MDVAVPEQIVCAAGEALTIGLGLITIVAVVVLKHPSLVEAFIVNMVVC
jgi:hypothetical protein